MLCIKYIWEQGENTRLLLHSQKSPLIFLTACCIAWYGQVMSGLIQQIIIIIIISYI